MSETASSKTVWVVDDDRSIRWVLERALTRDGAEVKCFDGAEPMLRALERKVPDVVITDIRMPEVDGFELLAAIQQQQPNLPVIIMTAHANMNNAVTSFEGGVYEYLPKPFDINDAVELVGRACEERRKVGAYTAPEPTIESVEESDDVVGSPGIIGKSSAMQDVFRAIGRLSKSSISVMVTGESGTGKELVASALHTHSPRSEQPFVAINTAAIPKELLESELFGHEKGAFTGAVTMRKGRFEQAHNGTLFLDEIGDMPAELQTRLLRVLAEGTFYRVGGHTPITVDVRIVAATHQDLEALVKQGVFREDLYHRLNVIHVEVPPLRSRRSDIPLLLRHFLRNSALDLQAEEKVLLPEVLDYLQEMPWPGNVRQLENFSRWITVMAPGREVTMDDLPDDLLNAEKVTLSGDWRALLSMDIRQRLQNGEQRILDELLPEFEYLVLDAALQQTGGRKKEAADLLGWGRNTLTRKLKERDS